MSRESMKGHVAFGGLDRDLVKINDHHDVFHVVYDLSIPGFLPRQFVDTVIWKWSSDKSKLSTVVDDVESVAFSGRKEYLRASNKGFTTYKQGAFAGEIHQTEVTWIVQLELGGAIPKWVQNRQGVSTLKYVRLLNLPPHAPSNPPIALLGT